MPNTIDTLLNSSISVTGLEVCNLMKKSGPKPSWLTSSEWGRKLTSYMEVPANLSSMATCAWKEWEAAKEKSLNECKAKSPKDDLAGTRNFESLVGAEIELRKANRKIVFIQEALTRFGKKISFWNLIYPRS